MKVVEHFTFFMQIVFN